METVELILHPPHTPKFEFFLFHPSPCVPSPSPTLSRFFHFLPLPDPTTLMPERPGPWAFDKVKRRLRQEQVARELAASARYRQQEQPLNNQQTPIQVESNVGRRSWSDCLLVVLVLFCFMLTLAVLALCGAVLSLLQKDNEK